MSQNSLDYIDLSDTEYEKAIDRDYYEYIYVLRMIGLPVELIERIKIYKRIFELVEVIKEFDYKNSDYYDYLLYLDIEDELNDLNKKL